MAELTSKIDATTGASRKAKKSLKGLASQATATGAAMATMGGAVGTATGAITGLGAALTTATGFTAAAAMQAKNFEQAMRGVARTAGLSEEEVGKLSTSLLDLSKTTPRGRIELAKIATEAGRLGIESTDNIRRFTNTVQQMAEVSELTVNRAATELAKISEALDRPISSIRSLADTIDKLSITTPSSTGQITRAMRKMASGMTDQVELSTEAVTALSASLTSLGQEPARAGTRLRRVLNQLTDPSVIKDMSEVMDTMSADEIRDQLKKDALPVLQDFLKQVKETGRQGEILNEIFVSSATAALLPMSENMQRLEKNLKSAGNSMGTVAEEFDTQLKNLNDQWRIFSGVVGSTMTEIGLEALEPMTKSVTSAVSNLRAGLDDELVNNLSKMSSAFGEFLGSIMAFSGTGVTTLFKIFEGLSLLTDLDLFGIEGLNLNNFVRGTSSALDSLRKNFEEEVLGIEQLTSDLDKSLTELLTIESTASAEKEVRRLRNMFEETAQQATRSSRKISDVVGSMEEVQEATKDWENIGPEQFTKTLTDTLNKQLKGLSPQETLVAKENIRENLKKAFPTKEDMERVLEQGGVGAVKNLLENAVKKGVKDVDLDDVPEEAQQKISASLKSIVDTTKTQRSIKQSFDKLKPIVDQERQGLFNLFEEEAPSTVIEGNREFIKTALNRMEGDMEDGWSTVFKSIKDNPARARVLELLAGFTSDEKTQAKNQMDISGLFGQLQLQKELSKQFQGLSSEQIQTKFSNELGNLKSVLKSRVGEKNFQEVLDISSQFASGELSVQQFNKELKKLGKNKEARKQIRRLAEEVLNLDINMDKAATTIKEDFAQSVRTGVKDAGNIMSQEFARLATEGKFSGERIGDALAGGIVESLNRRLVQQPLQQFLVGSGSNFGLLGSMLGMGSGTSGAGAGPGGFLRGGGKMFPSVIPGMAKGGKLRKGGLSIVGERGPEVLASQSNGRVMSNREMRDALKGGGKQPEINIINKSGEKTETRQRKQNGKPITDIIIGEVSKDIRQNGQVAQAMSSSFGVQRQGQRM